MYCGIDIIEVNRIKEAIERTPKFKENIFSKKEIEEIDNCSENIKYQRYAGRFAAKEATFKALSKILVENNLNLALNDVEILNNLNLKRRPEINILNDEVNNLINNYYIDISISHIEQTATAVCNVNLIN